MAAIDPRLAEVREYVHAAEAARDLFHTFPESFQVEEVRDSGAGAGVYAIRGLAAVHNKWSLDLGGFRERIRPGAFDNVLSRDPQVLHVWDHDTSKALSSTRGKTYRLELNSISSGLKFYSRVAPTTYSGDLRILMEDGVIDQSSFAFTVEKDEWRIRDDDTIERDVVEVRDLFDVTTCAMGAYPATESLLAVRSIMSRRSNQYFFPSQYQPSATGYVVPNVGGAGTTTTWVLSEPVVRSAPQSPETEEEIVAPDEAPAEPQVGDGEPQGEPQGEPEAPAPQPSQEELEARQKELEEKVAARQRAVRQRAYGPTGESK
jgi:HK97 family phage prohead protease